ncbi:unnamed protein product [Vicia faba]|uniref:ATP-dependent DNA helicase n=1 Tax=Vicia faba TaxID=3906 RepID=A0AAV0Z9H3_VICFA|nr:unnamed protein product [Vicia faba]
MWRTLASALRSKHNICLTVATSGIASLLLPEGRTAHSRFKIPVPNLDNSTCKTNYNDDNAELLRQAKLIIWDEAPMANRFCFEALDRTLRDVMSTYNNSNEVFGGKVVVFGGDFRQILSVISKGSRSDIVHTTINVSYIWHSVEHVTFSIFLTFQAKSSLILNHCIIPMTINKSQGNSLDWVGLYIPRDVFTHDQIYVALSRVTTKK